MLTARTGFFFHPYQIEVHNRHVAWTHVDVAISCLPTYENLKINTHSHIHTYIYMYIYELQRHHLLWMGAKLGLSPLGKNRFRCLTGKYVNLT